MTKASKHRNAVPDHQLEAAVEQPDKKPEQSEYVLWVPPANGAGCFPIMVPSTFFPLHEDSSEQACNKETEGGRHSGQHRSKKGLLSSLNRFLCQVLGGIKGGF